MDRPGFESPRGIGQYAQSAGTEVLKLGKTAVTGGLNGVILYIVKKLIYKLYTKLDEKYGIEATAAKWGEKVGTRVKDWVSHNSLSLPATR
ncbi:hypothetical protein GL213_13910 [Halogeometricum borinquense]|uniref:Uncharacterized protein n=1 Tax=Halogeometricum borinquense TaxID=60847 RepID=A0A6C0UCR2_9EURY|nr:hypothetical protein [Halogeometricum borinquense]QIB73075.1 hypothetical protein G3I44_01530 [Halogeometricum borinquense]QIQ77524.1 hypothetical protein GL213_13910 [Halogeometricum borinquense]